MQCTFFDRPIGATRAFSTRRFCSSRTRGATGASLPTPGEHSGLRPYRPYNVNEEGVVLDYSVLITAAFEARKSAYVPYSKFAVGAALLSVDGQIYLGCNIENVTFTPTICAERTAFFKAISEDVREFTAIAVVGGLADLEEGQVDFCTPCGVCRQVMVEFCGSDFKIITARSSDDWREYTLDQLLPEASKPKF